MSIPLYLTLDSIYSDDVYDQVLKKLFEENPQLDKKQLINKLISQL